MSAPASTKQKQKSKAANMVKEEPQSPVGGADFQDGVPIKEEPSEPGYNITTSSLGALQTKDSRQVMDIVDRLRRSGLSGELQLPQLVVCGDQSSGKSSVLEAITEIPFPRKATLCTRFATEIILRSASSPSISTKIIPDKYRPATEQKRLEEFKCAIMDFSELPNVIEEATKVMTSSTEATKTQAFFRDVLSIDISGPGRPHLTLVDLPGLVHSATNEHSAEDVEVIHDLVQDYIGEKRTIIMAVVSAKNDIANQIVLKKCREVDPKGHRTLGIITKPDSLEPGTHGEQAYLDLANNCNVALALGWHLLKNRSEKEMSLTFAERNDSETSFFNKGRYRDLRPEMKGIASLRDRLSQLLYKHLKAELPSLQKELNDKHRDVCKELTLLGEKRSTPQEQRRFLMRISETYKELVSSAVKGHYEADFFGGLDPDSPLDHVSNMRRLRAVVRHFNWQFAHIMRKHGQKSKIIEVDASQQVEQESPDHPELDDGYRDFIDLQESISREDAIKRVNNTLVRSRGEELPCTFNPSLISQLFWAESENWKIIAEYHIDRVATILASFVRIALHASVSSDVADNLMTLKIDDTLNTRLSSAKAELETLIQDTKRPPITYDPGYVTAVQQRRKKDREEVDTDKITAETALDDSLAYYEDEVKYFIAAVTKRVIERCLMTDLAGETISPLIVGEMSDDEVRFAAAEPEETTRGRDSLEARKAVLEKGQQTFKSALGLWK